MTDVPDPPPGLGETRAIELLRMVGGETPPVGERFTSDLIVRARRQRAVAVPLRAVGGLLAALVGALAEAVRAGSRWSRS